VCNLPEDVPRLPAKHRQTSSNIIKHHQTLKYLFLQNSLALDVGGIVSKIYVPLCQAGHLEANHTGNMQTFVQIAALWLQGHNGKANDD
jgi:hypothetical protein